MARLKIFDLRQTNLRTKKNVLQIFYDFQIAELFEHHYVQQAVIDNRVLKKRKWSAVAATVPNKNKRSLLDRSILRFYKQARRPSRGDLGGGNEVTKWA